MLKTQQNVIYHKLLFAVILRALSLVLVASLNCSSPVVELCSVQRCECVFIRIVRSVVVEIGYEFHPHLAAKTTL